MMKLKVEARIGNELRTIVKRHIDGLIMTGNVLEINDLGVDVTGVDFEEPVDIVLSLRKRD